MYYAPVSTTHKECKQYVQTMSTNVKIERNNRNQKKVAQFFSMGTKKNCQPRNLRTVKCIHKIKEKLRYIWKKAK